MIFYLGRRWDCYKVISKNNNFDSYRMPNDNLEAIVNVHINHVLPKSPKCTEKSWARICKPLKYMQNNTPKERHKS